MRLKKSVVSGVAVTAMAAAPLFAAPAQHQHDAAAPQAATMSHGVQNDAHYIDMMVMHHGMGIEMARIATDKAQRADVKALADKIITVQQGEQKELDGYKAGLKPDATRAAGAGGHDMASMPGMDDMKSMPEMKKGRMDMDRLQKASGATVDRLFLSSMAQHHQQAVQMSRQAMAKLKDSKVRAFAEKTITNQTREIGDIKKLQGAKSK